MAGSAKSMKRGPIIKANAVFKNISMQILQKAVWKAWKQKGQGSFEISSLFCEEMTLESNSESTYVFYTLK